jgi:hypothetical protein
MKITTRDDFTLATNVPVTGKTTIYSGEREYIIPTTRIDVFLSALRITALYEVKHD